MGDSSSAGSRCCQVNLGDADRGNTEPKGAQQGGFTESVGTWRAAGKRLPEGHQRSPKNLMQFDLQALRAEDGRRSQLGVGDLHSHSFRELTFEDVYAEGGREQPAAISEGLHMGSPVTCMFCTPRTRY